MVQDNMDIGNISNAYAEYYQSQNTISNKVADSIANKDYTNATDDELLDACKQFESYFLEQVFKSMEKTVDCFKEEGDTTNYSESMISYFGDETIQKLAETSTQTQGLGLAQSLYEQMKRNYGL